MNEIELLVDEVVEKAMQLANETGPDPHYRREAQKELASARKSLIDAVAKIQYSLTCANSEIKEFRREIRQRNGERC